MIAPGLDRHFGPFIVLMISECQLVCPSQRLECENEIDLNFKNATTLKSKLRNCYQQDYGQNRANEEEVSVTGKMCHTLQKAEVGRIQTLIKNYQMSPEEV